MGIRTLGERQNQECSKVRNTAAGSTWINSALPFTSGTAGTMMIAPMHDDLYMTSPGTGVTSQSVRVANPDAGTFVVTWAHEEYYQNTSPDITFQAVLFGVGNGAGAVPGTIVFCYDAMNAGAGSASFTSGLNKGNAVGFAALPGYAGPTAGTGSNADMTNLVNTGWTFRPDGNGGYVVTQGKIPSPSALALLGLGGVIAGRRKR